VSLARRVRSLDDDEVFWGLYILAVVVFALYSRAREQGREQGRAAAQSRQALEEARRRELRRDDLQLGEEALCHLEHGGTVELDRWHGGQLTVSAEEIVVDVTDPEDESS